MKSCKRWITKANAKCSLCRVESPAGAKGILIDIATEVEATTIVKFVCLDCATQISIEVRVGTSEPPATPRTSRGPR